VHVWRADVDADDDVLVELLSAEERGRAERFLEECAGRRWARSRGVLRALLGRYLQEDPLARSSSLRSWSTSRGSTTSAYTTRSMISHRGRERRNTLNDGRQP
jgi:hypothetical protein